ncbi:MAG: hypothetical protein DRO23_09890 [Thermoprotei archaeon]|nr:MAG: hypothetical protein DRO23_09890 [Thermoprotei archaeon]
MIPILSRKHTAIIVMVLLFLVGFVVFKPNSLPSVDIVDIKGANVVGTPTYAWGDFWANWRKAQLELRVELQLAKEMGLNLIEIYIRYDAFPKYDYWKLREFLRIAKKYGLWVIVTLNDDIYPSNLNYSYVEQHLKAVVNEIKNEPNLYAIGVLNEYNGRFGTNTTFAKWVIGKIREFTNNKVKIVFDLVVFSPIIEGNIYAVFRNLDVDFYSVSIYSIPPFHDILPKMYPTILETLQKILGKPIFLGEFGWRTDREKPEYNEEEQAKYYREVLERVNGKFGWSFWCLTDYKILKEKWGVLTENLEPKPVVDVIKEFTHQ